MGERRNSPTAPRVGKLDNLSEVRREAAALYKAGRRGDMPASDASRLATVLALVAKLIETSDIEARIEALEREHAPPGGFRPGAVR